MDILDDKDEDGTKSAKVVEKELLRSCCGWGWQESQGGASVGGSRLRRTHSMNAIATVLRE